MYIDVVPLNEPSFLYTTKSERVEAMREWKTKVNPGEAIWCSASKAIANQRYIHAVFVDLDTKKCSTNLGAGEIFPAALQRISTRLVLLGSEFW